MRLIRNVSFSTRHCNIDFLYYELSYQALQWEAKIKHQAYLLSVDLAASKEDFCQPPICHDIPEDILFD
ncbi:hypothetical protein TNCV_1102581 [Trichonephila clavipes]|nr:hypothetical protein TNCV_1102581 [Trichonephila clavipes]